MIEGSFVVAKAPFEDIGKDRIRLHIARRKGLKRFAIAKVTKGSHSETLCVLGSDGDQNDIQMNIDVRNAFGIGLGETVSFSIVPVGWAGSLSWYLSARDPAIRIPAWLAAWSVLLGALGFILSMVSLLR